jgi:hypothetical protein
MGTSAARYSFLAPFVHSLHVWDVHGNALYLTGDATTPKTDAFFTAMIQRCILRDGSTWNRLGDSIIFDGCVFYGGGYGNPQAKYAVDVVTMVTGANCVKMRDCNVTLPVRFKGLRLWIDGCNMELTSNPGNVPALVEYDGSAVGGTGHDEVSVIQNSTLYSLVGCSADALKIANTDRFTVGNGVRLNCGGALGKYDMNIDATCTYTTIERGVVLTNNALNNSGTGTQDNR